MSANTDTLTKISLQKMKENLLSLEESFKQGYYSPIVGKRLLKINSELNEIAYTLLLVKEGLYTEEEAITSLRPREKEAKPHGLMGRFFK